MHKLISILKKFKYHPRRHIYHYRVVKRNNTITGVILTVGKFDKVEDYDILKDILEDQWKESIPSIDSLSYLGRECYSSWIKSLFDIPIKE